MPDAGIDNSQIAGAADPEAVKTVRSFLSAVENRELDRAQGFLDAGFTMVFPGDRRMTRLADLSAWASTRYRFVRKIYDRFDVAGEVVYCVGTLSGEWLDGGAFSGIRFVDRFELRDGRIWSQQVWNDIGEVKGA